MSPTILLLPSLWSQYCARNTKCQWREFSPLLPDLEVCASWEDDVCVCVCAVRKVECCAIYCLARRPQRDVVTGDWPVITAFRPSIKLHTLIKLVSVKLRQPCWLCLPMCPSVFWVTEDGRGLDVTPPSGKHMHTGFKPPPSNTLSPACRAAQAA